VQKPTEQIMAWIATLSPPDELAVRMAMCELNPWCLQDKPWQSRLAELQAQFIKSDADRRHFEERAAKMAHDMEAEVENMKAQAADPTASPAPA
jgi:hypothetical protein